MGDKWLISGWVKSFATDAEMMITGVRTVKGMKTPPVKLYKVNGTWYETIKMETFFVPCKSPIWGDK